MNSIKLLCFLLLTAGNAVYGQLVWKNVSTEFGNVPGSVKVFKTTDSFDGRPFIAYYVVADLKAKNLEFTTQTGEGKRYTPSQYYLRDDSPLVVVNGTFFSFETNQNLNTVIRDGKLVAYNVPSLKSKKTDSFFYPSRSAIGISKRRKADVAWLFTDTAQQFPYAFERDPLLSNGIKPDPSFKDLNTFDKWKWWKMQTAIGGGPVLVHNKKIRVTNKEEQMFVNEENDRHPRTAMGYTRNRKLIILSVQGRFPGLAEGVTLQEEAQILLDLGCVEALNLEGGGSSCLLINGKQTIKPSDKGNERPVPGVFLIKMK